VILTEGDSCSGCCRVTVYYYWHCYILLDIGYFFGFLAEFFRLWKGGRPPGL
jgi:hypothetical protein